MKNFILITVLMLALCFFTACNTNVLEKKDTPEIKSIYRTKKEWNIRYNVPDYEENKELTKEDVDKIAAESPNLVTKCKTGTFVGKKDDDVLMWKGIPYAKAPTGEKRFKRSELPDNSDKYFEAYNFGKTAIQIEDMGEKSSLYKQGEDCLNLNVWTSENSEEGKKKPVFVYIHGGGWGYGGTSDPLYDGWNFAHYNPDILVVTLTYRVGMFGQINLTKVDSSFETSMVNGVLDQVTALKWIYENIEAFGGDPENINVAGESAGGGSVSLLCTLPEARKYMKKAMPMSGGANQATLVENTYTLGDAFIKAFNIKNKDDIAKLTEEELMKWWHDNEGSYLHHCVQDGVNIEKNPVNVWKRGDTKDLLVLQGHTANEFAYYLPQFSNDQEVFDKFCEEGVTILLEKNDPVTLDLFNKYKEALLSLGYKESDIAHEYFNDKSLAFINTYQASVHARNGGKGYSYTFEKSYDGPWEKLGAAHAVDCFYLFGNFDGNEAYGTDDEVELSRKYQKMISNFCICGDPSIEGYEWKEYNEDTRYKMMIGDNLRLEEDPEKARVAVEMEMVEKTEFFKPTTIAKIMERLAGKYPEMMTNFVIKNIEREENTTIYNNAIKDIGNMYTAIIQTIGQLTDEQNKQFFEKIVEYVNDKNNPEAVKIKNAIDFFIADGAIAIE